MSKPAKTIGDLDHLLRTRFPGMENYFITETYTPSKKRGPDPHKGHHFFIYCGFIDSLSFPVNSQCWRSVSIDGLYKLVLAEDPEFVHDAEMIPETRRRFRF